MSATQPPREVFAAFGATGTPERLSGGRGLTWRAGGVVIRPAGDPEEAVWKSGVLADLERTDEFTVPRPIPDRSGAWVHDGWEAWEWMPGTADESRLIDVIRAGAAFHRAIASLPQPGFIARSDDAWSRAERMAWGEDPLPADEMLGRLAAEFRPVESASQVIHGDLLGNVMFATGRPPAVIDWAPYWRPAGTGAAIAAVDGACWHGYPPARLADDHGIPEWSQLLVRALTFRIATWHLLGSWNDELADRHGATVDAVILLAAATAR